MGQRGNGRSLAASRTALTALGFESYAPSLATKMAENPRQLLDFLTDLAKRAVRGKELAQLCLRQSGWR